MESAPLIVIVGETASGKSGLAMQIAKKFNGEIISADSWQVYKGFDIGTAKPSKAEQTKVTHYMIDIAEPKQGFSAAEFKKIATQVIDAIQKKGKLPIVVGGTGLYVDSLLYDYNFLPAGPSGQRQKLDKLTIEQLLDELKARQISCDGIDTRNKRRLVRLLEVNGQRPSKRAIRPNTLIVGLQIEREQLKKQATNRVDTMLNVGLEKEVKGLAKRYGWKVEPMKGIGYQQWQLYFEGDQTLDQTRERIINSTMQLAKKQRTWFKRNNSIHWAKSPQEAVKLVSAFLNK